MQHTKLFVILDQFLISYPPNKQKNQNFEKMKNIMTTIWHVVPETGSMTNRIFCHSGQFFAVLTENQYFEKMKKSAGDIIILQMCTINGNHIYLLWDTECDTEFFVIMGQYDVHLSLWYIVPEVCDRLTDRKSDIERWVPHLKISKNILIKMFYFCTNIPSSW